MATHLGKNGYVLVSGTPDHIIGEMRGWQVDVTTDTVNTTVMGDDWHSMDPTMSGWTASFELLYDPADSGQLELVPGTKVDLEFYISSAVRGTLAAGDQRITGTGIVSTRGIAANYGEVDTTSVTITGDGPPVFDTVT